MGEQTISAAEAIRSFSSLLERVRQGESFLVTRDGKPVAKIEPVGVSSGVENAARKELLDHLRHQRAMGVGSWTDEELYD